MPQALSSDIADFVRRDMTFGGVTKPVLMIGDAGPAVIVMHEIFGFTAPLARFCRWIAAAGMRVYAPILLGEPHARNPQKVALGRTLQLCVSREFTLFAAGRASPVVDWLKPLAQQAHRECGGPGVGAIGMCLTGGFALAMAVDPVVLAPVLSQPGLPVRQAAALDLSAADLETIRVRTVTEGLCVRAYRFAGDTLSPAERFETLQKALGPAFTATTLPDAAGHPDGMRAEGKPPHSVFAGDLVDAAGEPTKAAAEELIAFLRKALAA